MSRHQSGWIEVSEVERALAALRAGEGHPSVRATTLNPVSYTHLTLPTICSV